MNSASFKKIAILTLLLTQPALSQERFIPAMNEVIVNESIHSVGVRTGELRLLERAWQASPNNLDASIAYARAVFIIGLQEADLRWFGSAKAALLPWWKSADLSAEGFFVRGLVKQGFHEFDEGLKDINLAIKKDPNKPEFWSWRFSLHLLRSDINGARQDILEITRLFGEKEANIYRGILSYRAGQPEKAIELLTAAIKDSQYQDVFSQDWLSFHLGEAYRLVGNSEQAISVWEKQLRKNPKSHLIRLSLTELYNYKGMYQKVLKVSGLGAESYLITDALLVQALLASRALKDPIESQLLTQIEARLKSQAMREENIIERPKLIYLIRYGKDPESGLTLSIDNWKHQNELPDAVLFIEAALLVNKPMTAKPVIEWFNKTGIKDQELNALILKLKAHPLWTGGHS
jgi:tetratricopeptide (TPR) repeat protein